MPKFAFVITGYLEGPSSKLIADLYMDGLREGILHNKPEIVGLVIRVVELDGSEVTVFEQFHKQNMLEDESHLGDPARDRAHKRYELEAGDG